MSTKKRKKINRYKQQEIKVVLGGFLAVLILTLIFGFAITSKKGPEKTDNKVSKESVAATEGNQKSEEASTEAKKEKEEKTTEEKTTEEKTTEEKSDEEESTEKEDEEEKVTVDENSSPFDPKTVSVDDDNWELILLDTENKLPDGYEPQLAPAVPNSGESLDKRVQPYYEQMYNAAKKEGVLLTPYSGYRSYATQSRLYTNKVNSYKSQGLSNYEAEKKAAKVCMLPGCSENNLGIAMDICNTNEDFNLTEQYAWLSEHAAEYGFIERYPSDKTEQTGVEASPWHWRFVGVENAQKMVESGQCLEEYLDS